MNTETPETLAAEIARLRQTVADTTDRIRTISRSLPPLTLKEVRALANGDQTLRTDVSAFMRQRFDGIDVTLLSRETEAWERLHVTGDHQRFRVIERSEDRYEVRELDSCNGFLVWDNILREESDRFVEADTYTIGAAREDAREAAQKGNEIMYWTVRDNEEPDSPVDGEVFDDESDADDLATEKNEREDESLHGFPFAWNHGWVYSDGTLYHNWHAALERAGFLLYRYVGPDGEADEVICGIDGGGYCFVSAHYAVFYAILAAENDWLIETSDGPRLVTLGE